MQVYVPVSISKSYCYTEWDPCIPHSITSIPV